MNRHQREFLHNTRQMKESPMSKDKAITKRTTGAAASKILRNIRGPILRCRVTEELITTAIRGNSGWCMASEAVKIAAPWAKNISSDLQTIRITDPRRGLRYVYLTPRITQTALILFDQGSALQPFSFTLRGASVHTSFKRVKLPDGTNKKQKIHALGRRRIVLPSKVGNIPDVVGGAPPKRTRPPLGTFRREFGLRAYTGNFEAANKVPTGAPSVSD